MRALCAHDGLPWHPGATRRALFGLLRDRRAGRVYVIASPGGREAGYAVLCFGYSLEFRGRDAFLDELYLDPRARGRGWGRAALAFLLREARREGVRALHLAVAPGNAPARRLYRRVGFLESDRILMTRILRRSGVRFRAARRGGRRAASR